MTRSGKRVLKIAMPGFIQFCLYFIIRPTNLEMFFFICIAIFTVIFFYSIIYTTTNIVPPTPIPCAYNLSWKTNIKKERILSKSNIKSKIITGIKDPKNLIYLSYLVVSNL